MCLCLCDDGTVREVTVDTRECVGVEVSVGGSCDDGTVRRVVMDTRECEGGRVRGCVTTGRYGT